VLGTDFAQDRSRRLVLPELLARTARRLPAKVALTMAGSDRSFASLYQRACRLGNALIAHGVEPGDRVALLFHDSLELVEAIFSCQLAGACAVPVNFRLTRDEIEYIVGHSGAAAVLADDVLAPLVSAPLTAGGTDAFEALILSGAGGPPEIDLREDDLALLMYTSGTTGRPKGAMLSHANLVVNTFNWVHELAPREDDVWLSGLPLFHIGGLNGLLPFIYLGGTTVIQRSTGFDAHATLELIEQHAVTACCFVPTQWAALSAAAAPGAAATLRLAIFGASPAPAPTLDAFREAFPHAEYVNAFGQTEMSSNTCFLKGADRIGSVGRPVVNVEARVIDADGVDVAPGEVGEIVYRGPTVMQGYFRDPHATEEAFAGGWFHSGDLVRADEAGFLYVVDRKKDMIVSGGENVYPAELERVLITHPAVAEVSVVGVAHPRWVETPVAIVVLHPGVHATEAELIAHLRTHLASYKKPSGVIFTDELPRNAAGKVLKRVLRAKLGGSHPASGP
jgi:acyl-CoA synthetase (AMP-forming)/AMP-acid ligase II